MMDMPTPCPRCSEIVELDDMRNIGSEKELYCKECVYELEGESNDQ